MRNRLLYILLLVMSVLSASAQTDTIRYVKTTANGGKYANDGKSWDTAKDNVQDAINDLYDYMQRNNLHSGSVYVAAGTYTPSESTGDGAKGILSTSFKIYDGIHLYGGFKGDETLTDAEKAAGERLINKRLLSTHPGWRGNKQSTASEITTTYGSTQQDTITRYDFKYATILSGNHNSSMQTQFTWDDTKKEYKTLFPGNSYHVVWFATNGFISDATKTGYADSLVYGASLDGFVIEGGNASGKTITKRDHTTMGGGVYMVKHATLINSVIRNCSASRRGGGVYMDDGGTMRDCYIYNCQTLGLGIIDGYGGGLCMDNDGAAKRVFMTNNVGRIGGGAAVVYDPDDHPRGGAKFKVNNFDPYISASIMANNTATTEAGGVLLYKGGTINHCTIVNNDCPGADIIISNVRYGRSGGLFINGAGQCFNSVLWGNTCTADNDMQYASYASKVSANAPVQKPQLFYTALTNRDITDWSGTQKQEVYDIQKVNNDKTSAAANYVLFTNPLIDSSNNPLSGAGHSSWSATGWKPDAKSYIADLGVQVSSLSEVKGFNKSAHTNQDFFYLRFFPVSTVGALRADIEVGQVAKLAPVDAPTSTTIPTIFVDPNRTLTDPSKTMGNSWDAPMQNISDAIYTMQQYITGNKYTGNTQILVKQGELTTAGPSSYLYKEGTEDADLQTAAIRPLDNMRIYGGYPKQLTGTNLMQTIDNVTYQRNPHEYVSRITGNIIGQWKTNSIHCISISNKSNVVIDGFHLYYGNSRPPIAPTSATADLGQQRGAAIIVGNKSASASNRKDLTDIVIRNCVLANGFSGDGGGAFAVSAYPNASSPVTVDVKMVNCIVRNNTSIDSTKTTPQLRGIITVVGKSTLTMDHCTITNNVGIPLETVTNSDGTGTIKIYNSAIYANATELLNDRSKLTTTNLASVYSGSNISGSDNLIDLLYKDKGTSSYPTSGFTPTFGYDRTNDKTYPRFVNPTRTIGDRRNEDDVALYGGVPDYMPMDMNPMVNAAGKAQISYNYDLTGLNTRTYGGAPDVGAVEDSKLPVTGTTYYVRTKDTGGDDSHDGKTWATAFATLTKALNMAYAGQDIWIAAGTYKEGKTVNMKAGVNVYGGFKAYGNPGKREGERDISNLKSEYQTILDGESNKYRVVYGSGITTATMWEGLTIQKGSLTTNGLGGGAYLDGSGIKMKNCLIRKNYVYATDFDHGGGGLYMKGCIVENSIIRNNMVRCNPKGSGAGVFMTGATLINSLIVENHSDKDHPGTNILGSALYIGTKSDIYDCTIAYNQGYDTGAISPVWDEATRASGDWVPNASRFYNTIFWSNFGYGGTGENYNTICRGYWRSALGVSGYMFNCYHSVPRAYYANEGVTGSGDNKSVNDLTRVYNTNNLSSATDYTVKSINNYYTLCKAQNLFNESQYSGYPDNSATSKLGYIETDNPYSINHGSKLAQYCINMGADEGETLKTTYGITEDIAGAARIQDCSIDKGAYEFNGASEIKPEKTTEKLSYYETTTATAPTTRELPVATYYVTQNGNAKGNASADSPDNAACGTKLQQVLDAAGRYKYDHPTAHVIVKLAKYDGTSTGGGYAPSRTTVYEGNEDDNPRLFSIQVPHGVEVQGGWAEDFKTRNPITNKTLLTGVFTSGDQTVNAYHVVTFTDRVFDEDGKPMTKTADDGTTKPKLLSDVLPQEHPSWSESTKVQTITPFTYSMLDGLYIEYGQATGTLLETQIGGAAVVPYYGYICNCIIENNTADNAGGGLYLQSGAMVGGSIIQNNTSNQYGGGIAVDEPATVSATTYPYIAFCTITGNTGTTRGGGLYFQTNLRSVCNVYWNNTSNDQGDVSGVTNNYDAEQNINNYPVNYSAVTNTRVAGVNNVSVSSVSTDAVRWEPDNGHTGTDYQFYGIGKSSVLARAGIPYDTYRYFIRLLPETNTLDIAGVPRAEKTDKSAVQQAYDGTALVNKNNFNVDIGARAINANFDVTQDTEHLFYRLFVVHTNSVNTTAAKVLQASTDEVYNQIGSSVANPFLRIDDALQYIVKARNNSEDARNHRFEIFLAGGTYYPYTDLYGTQGHVRSNTFAVPEGVTIIGGLDVSTTDHYYCQSTSGEVTITATVDGTKQTVILKGATTNAIRLDRTHYDMNKNSLIEPWEMEHQTILSGYAVGEDSEAKNVYHVITCNADPNSVGKLPDCTTGGKLNTTDGSLSGNTTVVADSYQEDNASKLHRAIIIDGVTITQGSAKDYEVASVKNRSWYFKGGGIFVSGDDAVEPTSFDSYSDNNKGKRNIPLVVSNCLFVNNNARLGGAIYTDGTADIVSCSFVQNEAISPDEADASDRMYVTYSGGGAIATTNTITVVNTIFANNEAKRGTGVILTAEQLKSTEGSDGKGKPVNTAATGQTGNEFAGKTGNDLAGFGGVLWAGDESSVTLMNCNSVKNKAYSYPSVFNTSINTGDNQRYFGLNSIFWGNEADSKGSVYLMNYGNSDSPVESLFFSAYEEGHGLPATIGTPDQRKYDITELKLFSQLYSIFNKKNNNVIINGDNDAVDGPNFISPSQEAGYDGYTQSADWLTYRVNSLTDAGWGELDQDTKGTFTKDAEGLYTGHGIYYDLAKFYNFGYGLTLLPIGDDKYMNYAENGKEGTRQMYRISPDPLGTVTEDYIDIGVYEYQHTQLHVEDGHEVDVIWVAESENTANGNDGTTQLKPTSDLQRAIETLLLSRNDHPKVVKIIGANNGTGGTFMPTYQLDEDNVGFQIHTGANNSIAALKQTIISGHAYEAKSLTIEGGYAPDILGHRDIEQYPVKLVMDKKSYYTDNNTAHLFLITDAEQWGTQGNLKGSTTSDDGTTIDQTKDQVTKSSQTKGQAMPITFDGLTFVNNYATAKHTEKKSNFTGTGGAAIYYREQFKTTDVDKDMKSTTEHLIGTGAPKLTIKNCIFQQNGAEASVPAVRIEKGGGRTLIYNSVFHSGSGNPLECTDTVSIVNCTFAMNGGHITLSDAATGTSSLYNSIIWQDDRNNGMKTQYEGIAVGDSMQYNAVTGITNTDETANYHNVGLDSRNYNAMEGPNFVNGDGNDISKRDYHINPGVRTLTRANYLLYARKVLGWVPKHTIKDKTGNDVTLNEKNILTMLADTGYTKDLAYKVRLYDGSMERGAYECSSAMQRVLFVNPNKVTGNMTGLSWQDAYGSGMVQRAVDAAAVYTYFNKNADDKTQAKSYVFIKGGDDNVTPETITLRNGVSVYGSIAQTYTKEPVAVKDETDKEIYNNGARTFENQPIDDYIKQVRADRSGLAAKTTKRTRIAGIATMATDYALGTLIDGFEVRSSDALTAPAVNISDDISDLVLRNMMIDGNTVNADDQGTGYPVVNLQHGLLYNALIYGNSVASGLPLVSVGANGTMLNCTVVADAAGQKTVSNAGAVINGLDYNSADKATDEDKTGTGTYTNCYAATGSPFAPYLRTGNVYTLPAFLTGHAPYYYQLHENSLAIDKGSNTVALPDRFKDYVDLTNDRDVLGNPRKLGNAVDMGCFETWRIADNDSRYATADDNHYPHEGSVVYIGKNASLSLGSTEGGTQIFTSENAFMPGYLLLKTGASLYGNGNVIHAPYVAAERSFPAQMQYTLMSMPFPYDYANALTTEMDNNGNITETKYTIPKGKTYNGETRSAWDYDFHTSDSPCWETMASTAVKACDGWLLNFGTQLTEATDIRFTGFGSKEGDYVYTEDGKAKTVTLTQYNQVPTDGSAHFTKLENMGWNLKGMPWLVSGYATKGSSDDSYAMSAPHVFYTVSANGNNFSTSKSWDAASTLDFGNAFFTQTAVIGDGNTENVTFALPLPSKTPDPAAKPFVALSDDSGFTDDVEVKADEDSKQLAFNIGSDGVKWQSFNDSVPQVYLLDGSGVALSLAGQAPVGVEMAMGYRTVKDGQLTVSLPNAEAFDGQSVWLKDKMTGAVTDLTQSAYILQASKGYTDNRLTLQIGGVRPDGTRISNEENDASWTVRVVEGRLQVNGVHTDDLVIIRTLSGAPVTRGRASSDTFVSQPLVHGVYVVTVNNRSKKVGL